MSFTDSYLKFTAMHFSRMVWFSFLLFISIASHAQLNTNNVMHTGRSRLYFGNYTGAIENFNMVIKLKPYLPEPYYYRGVAKLELDDYRGAKTDLDKALEIKPYFPEAVMSRGVAHYRLKEYEKAMKDYTRALEIGGENADLFNNRGICKAAMRDFEGAIDDYTKSIALKSKNFNAYLNRSIAYQMIKEWDKAIADCNQLVRIKSNSPMGYLSRGLVKVEKGDFASALRDFDVAISFDRENAFAYQNRGMVKQQLESYEAAIMDYDMALKLDPYMASAYFNRGIAKEMVGRESYQKDYDTASLLDSRFAKRPWQTAKERDDEYQKQLLAFQTQKKGNSTNEEDNLTDSISANQSSDSKIDLEELRKRRMKANLAIEDTREKPADDERSKNKVQYNETDIKLLPDFAIAVINKNQADKDNVGYFSMVIENHNSANNYDPYLMITHKEINTQKESTKAMVAVFDTKLKESPNIPNDLLHRGILLSLAGNYNKALEDLDKAIKFDERNLLAYFVRAFTRTKMVEVIEQIRLKEQQSGILIDNLKETTGSKGQVSIESYNDAISDYTVVLYMNPDFIFGYYNRGNTYAKSERYHSAIDEYSKAISLDPDFAEAYYNRGLVKILLNETEEAAKDLSRSGELGIHEAYNVIKRYCN
jgi:tetratricopeptide (TPR) repeat protein